MTHIVDNIYTEVKLKANDYLAINKIKYFEIYKTSKDISGVVEVILPELEYIGNNPNSHKSIISDKNPTPDAQFYIQGINWYNYKTGETFELQPYKIRDKAVWIGNKGEFIADITINTVDLFNDGRAFGLLQLDKEPIVDLGGTTKVSTTGRIQFREGKFGNATYVTSFGKIYVDFNSDYVEDPTFTISLWVYWSGRNATMPFGFKSYDLYCYGSKFGFNTANGDLYGIDFRPYRKKWIHVVATFKKGEYGDLWINGEKQILRQYYGRINVLNARITREASIYGWRNNRSYTPFGGVDQVRFIKGNVTDVEVDLLYGEVGSSPNPM